MRRHVLFVLLMATAVALADARLQARQDAGAAGEPAGTGTAQDAAESAQAPSAEEQAPAAGTPEHDPEAPAGTEEATLIAVPGGSALGMSILGNEEAPKSLVIVPWKSSELGASLGVAPLLDDSRQPVDRDVFMRSLRYYELRSGTR